MGEFFVRSNAFLLILHWNNNEFFVPFTESIDTKTEILKIEIEIQKKKGFLESVMKKLNNSRFSENAPKQVVDLEIKKKNDAEKQIKILEERIANLSSWELLL